MSDRRLAGGVALVDGALLIVGARLPWLTLFAGLQRLPGTQGSYGWALVVAGLAVALAGAGMAVGRLPDLRRPLDALGLVALGFCLGCWTGSGPSSASSGAHRSTCRAAGPASRSLPSVPRCSRSWGRGAGGRSDAPVGPRGTPFAPRGGRTRGHRRGHGSTLLGSLVAAPAGRGAAWAAGAPAARLGAALAGGGAFAWQRSGHRAGRLAAPAVAALPLAGSARCRSPGLGRGGLGGRGGRGAAGAAATPHGRDASGGAAAQRGGGGGGRRGTGAQRGRGRAAAIPRVVDTVVVHVRRRAGSPARLA